MRRTGAAGAGAVAGAAAALDFEPGPVHGSNVSLWGGSVGWVARSDSPDFPTLLHADRVRLAWPAPDAIAHYRAAGGLHVVEYRDGYEWHVDRVDPAHNPIGHLLIDTPIGPALAVATLAVMLLVALRR